MAQTRSRWIRRCGPSTMVSSSTVLSRLERRPDWQIANVDHCRYARGVFRRGSDCIASAPSGPAARGYELHRRDDPFQWGYACVTWNVAALRHAVVPAHRRARVRPAGPDGFLPALSPDHPRFDSVVRFPSVCAPDFERIGFLYLLGFFPACRIGPAEAGSRAESDALCGVAG